MRSSSGLKLVVIGGGIAGAELVRNLPHDIFDATLIEPKSQIECQALYPEYLAGTVKLEELTAPLQPFCDRMGVRLINERALLLDKNTAVCERSQIDFNVAVLAAGASQNFFGIKGAEKSFSLNSLKETERAKRFLEKERPKAIAIIGSGLTGVETACALREQIDSKIYIIEAKNMVIPQFSKNVSEVIHKMLLEKGIDILLSSDVKEVKGDSILFSDGSSLDCEMAFWTAGIKPPDIVRGLTLPKKHGQWLLTNTRLQSSANLFAIGDCAWVEIDGKIASKTAVEAEHQAAHLATNLARWAEGRHLLNYSILAPTNAPVALISLGCSSAVGVYGGICLAMPTKLIHALKGWIDKSFINRYK